jgi:phosphoglucomutase
VILVTDPDADRVGVAVRIGQGEYELLTGNQVGGLLIDFLIRDRGVRGPRNLLLKTIVTSEFGSQVARMAGLSVEDTLTGFKFIGDRILHHERKGDYAFFFGYEESYGYLASPIARDKDAVQASLLIAELSASCKHAGKTLTEALRELFENVGYFREDLISVTLPGVQGGQKIRELMEHLRKHPVRLSHSPLLYVEDYKTSRRLVLADTGRTTHEERLALPTSDVLKYVFSNGSWLAVRPSGTEPKIKIYLGSKGQSSSQCDSILQELRQIALDIVRK